MNIKYIRGDFSFRKAGQGAFYTGSIRPSTRDYASETKIKDFFLVYDCGSKSGTEFIKKEIQDFRQSLHNNTLQVLFLSHLDDDHVNSVNDLLDGITCEQVILPYLTPFERLCVAFRTIDKDTPYEDELLRFLGDPVTWLFRYNVRELVFIFGNNANAELGDPKNEDNDNPELNGLNLDEMADVPGPEIPVEINDAGYPGRNRIKFKKGNGRGFYKTAWEFYFHYQEAESLKDMLGLYESINRLFGIKITAADQLTQTNLIEILGNKTQLKELRKQWKDFFNDTNSTGIIILHKPINFNTVNINKSLSNYLLEKACNIHWHYTRQEYEANKGQKITAATLLTGDTGLKQFPFSTYIQQYIKDISVLQIPHHGSKTGWNSDKLENLNYRCLTTAILNFGWGNHYGHPSPEAIKGLHDHDFDIQFCNQFEGFTYRLWIKFN